MLRQATQNLITALYPRLSHEDELQGESNSISNQKELILRYISCKESLQNVPVMDFVDDGYTGSNFDRPGFQQMMDGVRNGKIDTIIVKDYCAIIGLNQKDLENQGILA